MVLTCVLRHPGGTMATLQENCRPCAWAPASPTAPTTRANPILQESPWDLCAGPVRDEGERLLKRKLLWLIGGCPHDLDPDDMRMDQSDVQVRPLPHTPSTIFTHPYGRPFAGDSSPFGGCL